MTVEPEKDPDFVPLILWERPVDAPEGTPAQVEVPYSIAKFLREHQREGNHDFILRLNSWIFEIRLKGCCWQARSLCLIASVECARSRTLMSFRAVEDAF